jgi:phosphoenolpyruvate---glycerone phosphotransferase subunit DhaL
MTVMNDTDANGTVALMLHAATQVTAAKDLLTKADQVIGDGDHGIGMARGCEAIRLKLEGQTFATPGAVFIASGQAMMMSVGGSSGAIFGTLFSATGKHLGDVPLLTATLFANALAEGLAAVQKRGGAKVGDKTLVDALAPASVAALQNTHGSLADALQAAATAATQGAEHTKDFVATLGRAKTLGERSLGHIDPGALSLSIWLTGMAAAAHTYTFS